MTKSKKILNMVKIYSTIKGNEIFSCENEITVRGVRYALRTSDMEAIRAYRLSELATLGEAFSFISRYFPGFGSSDLVGQLDDLDCIIDGECDEDKTERVTRQWGSDPCLWESERECIWQELLTGAIENYKRQS